MVDGENVGERSRRSGKPRRENLTIDSRNLIRKFSSSFISFSPKSTPKLRRVWLMETADDSHRLPLLSRDDSRHSMCFVNISCVGGIQLYESVVF
jgi:hypothetical protein